jgi:DNA-binding NarL/FixJ family response regulator
MGMLRILLVDDSEILLQSLKIILEQDPELSVTGTAKNGIEALELCEKLSPDIVLMDIRMPVCNGVEGTKLIKEKYPSIKILILTTFDDQEYINEALQNGADGYVLKDISDQDLLAALKSTAKGFSIIQGTVFRTLKTQIKSAIKENPVSENDFTFQLSERERNIIGLLIDGFSNKQIASKLDISEGTVRNIISGILAKLKLNDRTQLAVFAIKSNLLEQADE